MNTSDPECTIWSSVLLRVLVRSSLPWVLLVLVGGAVQHLARGDASNQLWLDFTMGKMHGEQVYTELNLEPKLQVGGDSPWRNLDVTGDFEYYPGDWVDLTSELTLGRTHQLDGLNTFEITPRLGLRVHFLKQVAVHVQTGNVPGQVEQGTAHHFMERLPMNRFDVSIFLRIEWRNFYYSDDSPSEHSWRLRGRLESKVSLNRRALSEVGVVYGIADVEEYYPLGDDITESFPNKTRARIGLGYRPRANHIIEVLYIRDWNIDSTDGEGTQDSNSLDLGWKILF